jgi:hypothetical protein
MKKIWSQGGRSIVSCSVAANLFYGEKFKGLTAATNIKPLERVTDEEGWILQRS